MTAQSGLDVFLDFSEVMGAALAIRTLFPLRLMLVHEQAGRGHIHHYQYDLQGLHRLQIVLAVVTAGDGMHDHLIGAGMPHQRRACVILLSASFLPALLAQALGLSHKAVRGRRQVTVVTVFGQPLFQRLHPLLQLSDQFISLGQSLRPFFILLSKLKQFF
jgi:hypothetical protein